MAAQCGAELTMMENRFVPARFKDGYGPIGAWFLLFKANVANGAGEDYNALRAHELKDFKRFGNKLLVWDYRKRQVLQTLEAGLAPLEAALSRCALVANDIPSLPFGRAAAGRRAQSPFDI